MDQWSPPIVLDSRTTAFGKIYIVREDLLEGGTKQRATIPFLSELQAAEVEEVVYASPFCGFAQVALAFSCQQLKLKATIFCESLPGEAEPIAHEFSQLAEKYGATLVLVPSLSVAERLAAEYTESRPRCCKIPLGLNHPRYLHYMAEKLKEQYEFLKIKLEKPLTRLWLPVGSGTLAHIFHSIIDDNCEIIGVDVHVLDHHQTRIRELADLPRVQLIDASERFCEPSARAAPVPSNIHYDAKVWEWIEKWGRDGDVWWNVAR